MATTERAQEATAGSGEPEVGQLVRDMTTDKVGVVMGDWAGRYMLRPLGGGLEWDAVKVAPLSAREELSIRLAVANSGNRWGK
ncbi:hypothetical protein ACH492_16780 [Streptomyces sp. NPDC019443]|uniref:hypothetical protein n=1 Tax=Streptomyces sp. NPDC019443 TaxID=3365061 RepID=UPI0037A04393